MSATFETFCDIRQQLAESGLPDGLPWWTALAKRYYSSGAKRLAARVGRGGAKSTSMVDFALNEVLFGDFTIPRGEVHFFAFVSQNKSEAGQRLRQIAARLDSLGIAFSKSDDEIVLKEENRGFRVFACQIGAVSGFRCIGFAADELAKWTNADNSANPAHEVIASVRAMTVTHPNAREFFVSSPLGTLDLHFAIMTEGDSAEQVTASAPSWVANPSISEAKTRKLEKNERVWRREYKAEPQHALSLAFDPELVAAAMRPLPTGLDWAQPILALDPSSGSDCAFASAFFAWGRPRRIGEPIEGVSPPRDEYGNDLSEYYVTDASGYPVKSDQGRFIVRADVEIEPRPILGVVEMDTAEPGWARYAGLDEIVAGLAQKCHRYDVNLVVGDQHLAPALEMEFRRHGIRYESYATTPTNKAEAVARLQRLLAGKQLVLPDDTDLKRELAEYREVIDAGGRLKYSPRSGVRSDRVSTLINALVAETEGAFPWSPLWAGRKGRGPISSPEQADLLGVTQQAA